MEINDFSLGMLLFILMINLYFLVKILYYCILEVRENSTYFTYLFKKLYVYKILHCCLIS